MKWIHNSFSALFHAQESLSTSCLLNAQSAKCLQITENYIYIVPFVSPMLVKYCGQILTHGATYTCSSKHAACACLFERHYQLMAVPCNRPTMTL